MTSEGERVDRLRYLMDNAVGADLLPPAWREIANAAPFLLDVVEAARPLGDIAHHEYCTSTYDVEECSAMRSALSALDSHLSAASERETPE